MSSAMSAAPSARHSRVSSRQWAPYSASNLGTPPAKVRPDARTDPRRDADLRLTEPPLDEPLGSPMLDGTDFLARLDAVEERLDRHAQTEPPSGLTEPDPGGTERWEAPQVWAHMAEFVGYWQGQLESVIGEYDGTPVPFGRTKTDPGRIAAIETGRTEPIAALRARVHDSIEALKRHLATLTSAEWNAVGRHPTLGDMDVERAVEHFVISHLEEHAAQLDSLR